MVARTLFVLAACCACGDNHVLVTPESVAATGQDGQRVEVTGEVHTVTFDSVMSAQRQAALARRAGEPTLAWLVDEDDEAEAGQPHAYGDPPDGYPRTPDHYVLIRSATPDGITFGTPAFTPGLLKE